MLRQTWMAFARKTADRMGARSVLGVGNEQYVRTAPCPANALNLFSGMWSSKLPGPLANEPAGTAGLFEDPRIEWGISQFGGVAGASVLELGTLEAGHSYMLLKHGAAKVTAIEANGQAFLRCLVVKELLGLERVQFLCGDFIEYLKKPHPQYDLVVASGVLYHMVNPVELIELLSRTATSLFLWSHYYDHDVIQANPRLAAKFHPAKSAVHAGFAHTVHPQDYGPALQWSGFCGGSAPGSNWMSRADLLACLEHFGYRVLGIAFDEPHHQNGPSLALAATKKPA